MGVPRVWAIKRDHGAPLGKRGRTGTASWSLVLVFLSSSVVVSVTTTAATTADYPDDKVTLPPPADTASRVLCALTAPLPSITSEPYNQSHAKYKHTTTFNHHTCEWCRFEVSEPNMWMVRTHTMMHGYAHAPR